MQPKRRQRGEVREDGKVFIEYRKGYRDGEYWAPPEYLAALRAKARPAAKTTFAPFKSRHLRTYAKRQPRHTDGLIQKAFDTPPYDVDVDPAMNEKLELTVIPNFSDYAISPDGVVVRQKAARRGRTCGVVGYRVTPVIHPRGHQWCVQMTDDTGKRRRIPIKRLMEQVFGHPEIVS